jgi:hypothetical protein
MFMAKILVQIKDHRATENNFLPRALACFQLLKFPTWAFRFFMGLKPKILVFGLELEWPGAARLPRALQDAGFAVAVACRPRAFLAHTRFREHFFPLPEKNYGAGIFAAIKIIANAWPPDLILPMDDQAALFLAQAFESGKNEKNPEPIYGLLRRSLGNPAAIFEAASKRLTMQAAHSLGVRVPETREIFAHADVLEFGREHGFPIVLKVSFAYGGNGVIICRTEAETAAALARLRRRKTFRARLALARERLRGRMLGDSWLPADRGITASRFIAGKNATTLAAAGEGKLLAALTAVAEKTFPGEQGPSSVVRFVVHEEMRQAAENLLGRWKITGLIGFDFRLDAEGRAWLIECNPRPTPLAHLGARAGEDLCRALKNWLTGAPVTRGELKNDFLVAHFPQETWRDPQSPYLTSAFHDVPADDPELEQCLRQHQPPARPENAR